MTRQELQEFLADYPADMQMKIMIDKKTQTVVDLKEENILHSSESAYVDTEAPDGEWDCEDGKIKLGDGKQYLLFNPIII